MSKYANRLQDYLKATNRGGNIFLCILHDDHEPSMTYHQNGYAHCFSCGGNASITDFAAFDIGVPNTRENYAAIAGHIERVLGITQAPDENAQTLETRLVKLAAKICGMKEIAGSQLWPYKDKSGKIVFYDVRVNDASGGKSVISITPELKAKGVPLAWYNADKVHKDKTKPIMVHEGAKCASYAETLFPDFIHTTTNRFSSSGAKNAPVGEIFSKRDVYLYPDNDIPGFKAMAFLYRRIKPYASSITIIDVPPELTSIKGADIADCEVAPDITRTIQLEELEARADAGIRAKMAEDELAFAMDKPDFATRLLGVRNIPELGTDLDFVDFLLKIADSEILYTNSMGLMLWDSALGAFNKIGAEAKIANIIFDFSNNLEELQATGQLPLESDYYVKTCFQYLGKYLRSNRGVENIIKVLKKRAYKNDSELNPYPYMLNCRGYAVDLRNGEITKSTPAMRFTSWTNISPHKASPKVFNQFLDSLELTGGEREYILRYLGYCLTGETAPHKFLDLCGTGRNGKGTLLRIISAVMGSYAVTLSDDLVLSTGNNKNLDPAKLALFGRRFAYAPDLGNDGQSIRADEVKKLVGGDTLSARPLYTTQYTEWQNTAKLCFATNHELKLKDTGISMRSRIRYIKFLKSFAGQEDFDLDEKLKAEAPQILNLLIEYAMKYYQEGLPDYEDVIRNTGAMIDSQDYTAQFIKSVDEDLVGRSELWERYKTWCDDQGLKGLPKVLWRSKLFENGVKEAQTGGVKTYRLRYRGQEDG